MSTQKQEKTVDTQRQTAVEEPALEASTWFAPFNSGTFLSLQNTIGNRAVSQLLQTDPAHLVHNGNGNGHKLNHAPKSIQKKPQEGAATERTTRTPEPEAPARTLIVEDDAQEIQPGQMRKTEFLDRLKTSVCGAAEEALRNTMWSAMGCPYIERWFSHYGAQSSQYVERALRRYAPETARATSAEAYIPIVTERVRRGLSQWAETGEMTGVPEEFRQGEMPGVTLQGLVSTALTGIGRAIGSAASAVGNAASSVGRALFKAREGGEKDVGDPEAIRGQLGHGHSLDGKTRQRMENAFGTSFSGVRVHTGAQAENLSRNMNARAFTVGNDIAFGAGEYSPGTLVGDALIAHELAHTVQQGNGSSAQVASRGDHSHGALEEQADVAAVHAVASAWGLQAASTRPAGVFTQFRSGLRLQRCGARQQTRTLAEYQGMTPWQLSRVPDEEFDRAAATAQSSGGLSISDYKRAAQFAREYFNAYQINFDIDTYDRPLGEEPNDAQLAILNTILDQILEMDGGAVRGMVARGRGGRGLPRQSGSQTPTLRGRVRIWPDNDERSRGQYAAKSYRLFRTIGIAPPNLETLVLEELRRVGIAQPSPSRITRQERLVTIFAVAGLTSSGFYLPVEDIFYLKPGTDLDDPRVRGVARHEMAHLLGGAEQTRTAFRNRYGADYLRLWRPFEEGMAELIRAETQTEAERRALAAGETTDSGSVGEDPFYVASQEWIRRLSAAAPGNRQLLLNAYFTGTISNEVFQLLESIPPPSQ